VTPRATAADLDALYLGDFDGFVARRDELAKRLRADGEADGTDRVAKAIEAIERIVDADGATLSSAAAERVRQTLHAVALDDDVRRDFEAHRLEADRDASGLTEIPTGAGSRLKPAKKPTKADKGQARRERAALKQARAEARRAERNELDAEKAVDAARRAAAEAHRQLDVAADALEKAAAEAASTRQRADDLGAVAG